MSDFIKNKKNIKKITLLLLSSIIIALFIEVGIFNSNRLFLSSQERGNQMMPLDSLKIEGAELTEDGLLITNPEAVIEFNNKGNYIEKLVINYQTKKHFVTKIVVDGENSYGGESELVFKPKNAAAPNNSFALDVSSTSIKSDTKDVKIEITSEIDSSIIITGVSVNNNIDINKYRVGFFMLSIILLGSILLFRKFIFDKIERAFLLISIIIGSMLILYTPTMTGISMDDIVHYSNSNTLLQVGDTNISQSAFLLSQGYAFNSNLVDSKEEVESMNTYLNQQNEEKGLPSQSRKFIGYSRIGYTPSAVFLKIANTINLSFTTTFMLGKLANLIFYCVCMFFAIKIIPFAKKIVSVIGLLPTSMFLATNYSLDPIILGLLTLSVSLFLREYVSERKLSPKSALLFIVITLFGVFPKAAYAPVLLLPLLFKKSKFKNKKAYICFKIGIVILFLGMMSSFVLPTILSPQIQGDLRAASTTSPSTQLSLILHNIPTYFSVFWNNAGDQFLLKFFGNDTLTFMGWLGHLSRNAYFVVLFIIIFVVIYDKPDSKLEFNKLFTVKSRLFIFILIIMSIGLIWTALYLDFSAVGSTKINGVQGRYFIPLLFPLLLCCYNFVSLKLNVSKEKIDLFIYGGMSIILICGVYFNIVKVFYF